MRVKALSIEEATIKFGWPRLNPSQCELTITYSCNARCAHCYTPPGAGDGTMDLKSCAGHMYSARRKGASFLTLTGGEPTLNPSLPEIIALGRKMGYTFILLISNGIRLADYRYAKSLRDAGLNILKISLHSANPAVHDEITGIPSFRHAVSALENAVKLGIYTEANSVVTALNYRDLPSLNKFCAEEFGIVNCMIFYHPKGKARINKKKLKISYSEQIPYIMESLDIIREKELEPSCHLLGNYLPCVLPGCEHLMMDWKREENILTDRCYTDSFSSEVIDIYRPERMKGPLCRKCIYREKCIGFEKEYFRNFGDSEFRPVSAKKKPYPLASFYYGTEE